MTKTIPELFVMLKSTKVEIKKEHQVLMVDKITSFKKRAKENKGNFKKNGKQVVTPIKKPKIDLNLKLSASTSKGMITGIGTTPYIWRIRRMEK